MHNHRVILIICTIMSMSVMCAESEITVSKHVPIVVSSEYVPELSYETEPDEVEFFLEDIRPEESSAMKVWLQGKGARAFMLYLACKQYLKEKYNMVLGWMTFRFMQSGERNA